MLDGAGGGAIAADVAVTGDRIVFVGDAAAAGVEALDTLDVAGLVVTPGFIDMHSHAELDANRGRDARAFLYQGITSVALGVDGGGSAEVAARLSGWEEGGIGVNAFVFVGHNRVRRQVMGMEDRAPSGEELDAMRDLVRQGMDQGAYGLSSGLFYLPGNYAETEEVIELNRVAAEYPGAIYDTHDRDLGAAYPPFGYLKSNRRGYPDRGGSRDEGRFQPFQRPGLAQLRQGSRGGRPDRRRAGAWGRGRGRPPLLHRDPVEPALLHGPELGGGRC